MEDADNLSPKFITAKKTAKFQLRAPSNWKRAAILDAMKRTHLATAAVLDALHGEIQAIKALSSKADRKALMQRVAYETLRGRGLTTTSAAAARVDALALVECHLSELKDGRVRASWPKLSPVIDQTTGYNEALECLSRSHLDAPTEHDTVSELKRHAVQQTWRPLSLHGYGHFFRILRHPKTNRLFAWIRLLARDSRFNRGQGFANTRATAGTGEMIDLASGELISCNRPSWILCPISFGHEYHQLGFMDQAEIGGGRLVYRPQSGCFELHTSWRFKTNAIRTDRKYLGVDRGIYNLAAWAAIDERFALSAVGAFSGLALRDVQRRQENCRQQLQKRRVYVRGSTRRAHAEQAVHLTANLIVGLAAKLKARVVLEKLHIQRRPGQSKHKGGFYGRNLRRVLGRQQYGRLQQILTYKMAIAGLPPAIEVDASHTSQTCPMCGHCSRENRIKHRQRGRELTRPNKFSCVACHFAADADCNAAHMIALKGAWVDSLPTLKQRKGRKLASSEWFDHFLQNSIETRGSSGAVSEAPVPS